MFKRHGCTGPIYFRFLFIKIVQLYLLGIMNEAYMFTSYLGCEN